MAKKEEKTFTRLLDKCPECSSTSLIHDYDAGEAVCTLCGLVLEDDMLNDGPEWRAFTPEDKTSKSRVGLPIMYSTADKGLSTTISQIDQDAFGKKLPISTRLHMWRLRQWQIRSRMYSSIERNLTIAMSELDLLSNKLAIPTSIKEKTAVTYRKALDKGLVRGRSISAIVAASLYTACRDSKTPRTLQEITQASLANKKEVARCYRILLRELDIKMPIADPLTHVSKIAENLGISGKTQGIAITLLHEARKKHFTAGKDPIGLAAAALYIACLTNKERITQKEIAEIAGVTEVTVRNRYKTLQNQLKVIMPYRKTKYGFSLTPK